MSTPSSESSTRQVIDSSQLPPSVLNAHKELGRLHHLRQPHHEIVSRLDKEMSEHKEILKDYCERQDQHRDVGPCTTEINEEGPNPVSIKCIPSIIKPVAKAEDALTAARKVLNNLAQRSSIKLIESLSQIKELTDVLEDSHWKQIEETINQSMTFNVMEALIAIRKGADENAGGIKIRYAMRTSSGDSSANKRPRSP